MSSVAAVYILHRAGSSLLYSVMEPAGRYAVFSLHGHIGGMGKRFIVGSLEIALVDVCGVPIPKLLAQCGMGIEKTRVANLLPVFFLY